MSSHGGKKDNGEAGAAAGGKIGQFAFRGAVGAETGSAASSSAQGKQPQSTSEGFHAFLQRRQPEDTSSSGGSAVHISGTSEAGGGQMATSASGQQAEGAAASSRKRQGTPFDSGTTATSQQPSTSAGRSLPSPATTTTSVGAGQSTGALRGSASGGSAAPLARGGILAQFLPQVRDSPNYSPPPASIPPPASATADAAAGAAVSSGATQTPPSQPLPAGAGAAAGNRVLVHPRQKGNKVLDYIRNVPYEFNESISPDFLVGQRHCINFLSLRYHKLHPEYVHGRLREMGRGYSLRVLLVLIDMTDSDDSLRELSRIAIGKGLSLLVASSEKEVGRYIETFKLYENKPADMLQGHKPEDYLSQLRNALTTVKSVNKTDTVTLLTTFGCLKDIMQASADDLRMCPGFGEQKAARLQAVFDTPFNTRGTKSKATRL